MKGKTHILGWFICTVNLSHCKLVNTAGSVAGLNWLCVFHMDGYLKIKNSPDNIILCFLGYRRNVGRFLFCQKRGKFSGEASRHTWADNSIWGFLKCWSPMFQVRNTYQNKLKDVLSSCHLPCYDTSSFQCPTAFWTFYFPFQVMR